MKNKLLKLTLINKKSKKVASKNHWWLALGAHAHLIGDTHGIAGLLPHHRGKKLLKNNYLTLKYKRPFVLKSTPKRARQEARYVLPRLEKVYRSKLKPHQKFLKGKFCKWIYIEINTPGTQANQIAKELNLNLVHEGKQSVRWWMDQLKKCRVPQ